MSKELFKVQYIDIEEREKHKANPKKYENLPEWKKKVNSICIEFTSVIERMRDACPNACDFMLNACLDFGDPNDYAKYEVYYTNSIQYNELHHEYFMIDTKTLKITDPDPSKDENGDWICTEMMWEDKYEYEMENKLYE